MYLRRREISPNVTQEPLRDNDAEVPLHGVCQNLHTLCSPNRFLNWYSTGLHLSVRARSR
jgi:hypothetical protein